MVQILDQYGRPLNKEVLKAPRPPARSSCSVTGQLTLAGNDHCPASSPAGSG
jgi:hypothetical protein